jgi:hypothetical protein
MFLSLPLLLFGCGSTDKSSNGIEQVQPTAEHHPEPAGVRGTHSADQRIFVTADGRDIPGSRYTPISSFGAAD